MKVSFVLRDLRVLLLRLERIRDTDAAYVVKRAIAALEAEPDLTDAASAVLGERQRQIEAEGWTPTHDDEHTSGEMAMAAACYATASLVPEGDEVERLHLLLWPWSDEWWKPRDQRHNLVRAAALLLAEIERLDRQAEAS